MKEYEIWIGYVPPIQGEEGVYNPDPQMVGKETAINFKVACCKHELRSSLESIEKQEKTGHVDSQSLEWFYNPRSNSNSWIGPYFETREEALKTFPQP